MRPVTANATITVPKKGQRPYQPDGELLSSSGFNGTISVINKPGNPSSITSSLSEVVIPMNISTSHSSQDQQEQNNPTPHLHPSLSGKYAFNRNFMGKQYAGKNRGENNDKNIIDHNGSDEETMNGVVRSTSANSFLKRGYMMNTITSRQRKKERTIDKISSIDSMNDLSVNSSDSREDRLSSPFSQNASNLLDQGAQKKPKSKSNDTNSMRTSGIPIIRSVDSVSYRTQDQIELGGAFMDPHSQQITHEQKKELEEVVDANTEMIDQLFSLSKQKGNEISFSNSSSVLSSSSLSSMNERQKHRMKTLFTISTQQQQLQQSESSHYQRHLQRNSSLIHHRKQVEDTYDYKPFQRDRTKFQRITDLPTLQVRLVVDRVQGLYNFHQQVKHRERMLAYPCVSPEEKDNLVEAARHLNEPFLNFLYDNLNIVSSFEEEEADEIEEHKEVLTEQNQLGS